MERGKSMGVSSFLFLARLRYQKPTKRGDEHAHKTDNAVVVDVHGVVSIRMGLVWRDQRIEK